MACCEIRWHIASFLDYRQDGLEGHLDHNVIPTGTKLGGKRRLNQLFHPFYVGFDIYFHGLLFEDLQSLDECLLVSCHEDRGVDIVLPQKGFRLSQHFGRQTNDRRSTIAHFFVLGSGQFQHAFGRRMRHVHFAQNGVAVVGEHNAPHWVEQHFEHGLGTQRGTNNGCHGLGRTNIGQLSLSARLALSLLVCCGTKRGNIKRVRRGVRGRATRRYLRTTTY